jgi:hypothetical protein
VLLAESLRDIFLLTGKGWGGVRTHFGVICELAGIHARLCVRGNPCFSLGDFVYNQTHVFKGSEAAEETPRAVAKIIHNILFFSA